MHSTELLKTIVHQVNNGVGKYSIPDFQTDGLVLERIKQ